MRTDPRTACRNERQRLLWALVHDALAHPLMALTGYCAASVRFHDWTSHKAWPRAKVQYHGCDFKQCQEVEAKLRSDHVAFMTRATPNYQTLQTNGYIYRIELL